MTRNNGGWDIQAKIPIDIFLRNPLSLSRPFKTRFRRKERMIARALWRWLLGLMTVALLGVAAASPAAAYGGGPANWQLGFAGTATYPSTGFGFGFWGWCQFSGGVVSGNDGDCQVAQYLHAPRGSNLPAVTCHQSVDITSWTGAGGTFVITGTSTTTPSSAAQLCQATGGAPPSFSGFDTMLPASPGHYSIPISIFAPGAVGELQIQVTQIPH